MTRLFMAWVEFEFRCEEFDRTLPGAWLEHDPDVWMPRPEFHPQMQRHAFAVLREMRERMARMGVAMSFRDRERHAVSRLRHEDLRDLMRQANDAAVNPTASTSDGLLSTYRDDDTKPRRRVRS